MAANVSPVISTLIIPVAEYRTKWERIWPKDEQRSEVIKPQESFVRSRVQRYSINNSKQFSKQIGFINTVNTAKVSENSNQPHLWVVHNALPPKTAPRVIEKPKIYESSIFFQPSINKPK